MGNNNKLMTPKFRVSFPQVFEPRAVGESTKKKYSMVMLFSVAEIDKSPEAKKQWADMIAAAKFIANEKWPKGIPANLQWPFRKGEEKEQYQGYGPGVIFVTATTTTRPGLVDERKVAIINPEDFYAGCYARATVNPYAWTYMGKNGVSFGLQNIQKLADGEPFSGRTNAEDDFDATGEFPASAGDSAGNAAMFS